VGIRPLNVFSEFIQTARPVVLIAVLISFSLWTNQAVIDFRMKEMGRAMAALSRSYNNTSALNMLARYEMIRQRGTLPEDKETALELRLQAMAKAPADSVRVEPNQPLRFQERVITWLIQGVRFILGKKERVYDIPEATRRDLELGYFYERGRKYVQAVQVYSRAIAGGGLSNQVLSTMRLHRGFCLSLLGDIKGAKQDFESIRALVGESDENRVAMHMLSILKGMEDEIRLARQQELGPFEQGKRLFKLGSTIEAMNLFNQVLSDSKSSSGQKLEARYWFGRAQEEMGQDSEAVNTFRSVVADAPQSQVAQMANRRLYVLGKYYQNDADLEKAALKQLEKYQDFQFIDALKSVESRGSGLRVVSRLGALGVKNLGSNINSDHLEGQPAKPEPVAALRRRDTVPDEPGSLQASLRKIPERQRTVKRIQADPLRREAILGTIQGNRGELEFIFQKWLRKGQSFEGKLTLRILIAPDGVVKEARAVSEKSTIDQAAFVADILQNVKRWRFRGDPGETADIPVSFPLDFKSRE